MSKKGKKWNKMTYEKTIKTPKFWRFLLTKM